MKHHLMVGTWTPPGRIYTVQFDDEALTLTKLKKTDIPEAEPISWMAFSVCFKSRFSPLNMPRIGMSRTRS